MIFTQTELSGAYIIELEKLQDPRGFFARTWCKREFEEKGLNTNLAQCNMSCTEKKGTFRGMHYQAAPYREAKLIRCTSGSIFDVIIDLRPDSQTFKKCFCVELSNANKKMLYVPEDFAHGFLTLEDHTEVFYQMSEFYHPGSARGLRWNDPAFSITLPAKVEAIADRDAQYPDFTL